MDFLQPVVLMLQHVVNLLFGFRLQPFFFVFAVVFTAFLLNGVTMAVLVIFELAWYAALSLHTYYNPMSVKMNASKEVFIMDAIVCETIVSISLAVTMYFQIRVYRKIS